MSRKSKKPRSKARKLLAVVVLIVLAGLGYAVTLGPVHAARAKAEVCDGLQPIDVADGITITPAQDWLNEPLVDTVVDLPAIPDVHSWDVYFDRQDGTLLRSPDRSLTVEIDAHGPGTASEAETLLRDRAGAILGRDAEIPAIRTEVLGSGTTVWHLDAAATLLAVVSLDGQLVSVVAEHDKSEPIEAYRPAIGQLIETIA